LRRRRSTCSTKREWCELSDFHQQLHFAAISLLVVSIALAF
jgi:hypothetical protein